MRWTRWITLLSVASASAIAVQTIAIQAATTSATSSGTPAKATASSAKNPQSDAAAKKKKIERGRYLTMIMSCNDCHTPGTLFGAPDFSRQLSGSELGWQGPWGTTYARNLTPDLETGLGYWTADDIVKALRTGVTPDGRALRPPMPWQMIMNGTDEDLYAIAAYLLSLPVVSHKVPDALAPGEAATGSVLVWPAPSAWDAPKAPPDSAAKSK